MPDVGVLQLEIRDNSTEAGQGLNQLAKALSAVQSAVGNGLNLTGITAPLNRFAKSINEHGSGKTLQSVGSFLKALSDYRKAFSDASNVKFDAEPISQLKAAIGDGIKLGQAGTQIKNIREALEGEWNVDNAYRAGQALAAIGEGAKSIPGGLDKKADQIKKVAEALREYTSASQEAKNVLVGQSAQMNALEDSARKQREWFDQGGFSTGKRMPLNLQFFAEKPDVSGLEEVKSSVQNITEGFKEYKASVEEAKASSSNLDVSGSLSKTEDAMSSISSSIRDFIDLTKIPASGLVGPFKTAGEEVEHITKQIDEQKISLAQWEQVFEKTQRAIKYNGATQDRTNMLGHAEEGFYSAYEKLNDYDRLLNQVLENANKYSKTAVKPIEEVTEAVGHAMEKVEGYGTGGIRELYASTNALGSALRGELGQAERIKAIAKVAEGTGLSKGEINKQLVECRENADKARQSIESLVDTLNKPVGKLNWANSVDRMLGIGAGIKSAAESAQVFSGVNSAVNENATAVSKLSAKYHELKDSIVDSFKSAGGLSGVWKNFGNGIKSMFPTLSGMVKRLGAIAKYRFLRTVIKHITSGFSEGLQNVYEYSKAVGGTFAPAMDSAASAIATMKNSLGAALTPVIQALIPYVNQLVNWFINLVNYANQFFALLAGQSTWTRALPATANAFDKQKKAAKGAGSAIKDLLADWDELNIIQSESGSGGGGAAQSAEDYLKMFEEVGRFDNKVKDIINDINEQFGSVWNLVKRIGAVILAWKASSAFTGLIGQLAGFVGGASTIKLIFDVSTMMTKNYLDTGEAGWLVGDFLSTLVGGFIAKRLLKNVLKGSIAKYAIPISFAVSAGATIKALVEDPDVSALSEESILASLNAALEGGVASGSALYSLGVGATAGEIAGVGLAGALFTFGMSIGLKAIADTVDCGEITKDTIKANLLSATSIGAGLAISTATLSSTATIGTIIATGASGALFTLGALILIEAVIAKQPAKIAWGDQRLTMAEVQEFVRSSMMNSKFDLAANLELSANSVTMIDDAKTDLRAKVAALANPLDALILGVNVKDSLTELDDLINNESDGLIAKFNELQKAKQNRINVAIAAVFPEVSEGDENSPAKKYAALFGESYAMMEGVMADLGRQLSEALSKAYDESLDEESRKMARQTVVSVTNAMSQVASINTANQSLITLRNKLSEGMMDQQSMQSTLDFYKTQIDESAEYVSSEYQALIDEAELNVMNYEDFARLALENGGEFAGYKYEEYVEMAEKFKDAVIQMKDARDEAQKAALDFYTKGEGYEMVRNAMLKYTEGRDFSIYNGIFAGDGDESYFGGIRTLFTGEDSVLKGNKAGQNIEDLLKNMILQSFNQSDWPAVKQALDTGILKYTDFLNAEMVSQLANRMGLEGEARDIWDEYISNLFGVDMKELIEKRAKPAADEAEESIQNVVTSKEAFDEIMKKPLFGTQEPVNEQLKFDIEPVLDVNELYNDIIDKIYDSDLADKTVPLDLTFDLWYKNDLEGLQKLKELTDGGFNDESVQRLQNYVNGFDWSVGKNGSGYVANVPTYVPQTNGAFLNGSETVKTEAADPAQEASNVENGVRRGNKNLEDLLDRLITATNRAADRPITFSLFPSSGWGFHNVASGVAVDKVTGNV